MTDRKSRFALSSNGWGEFNIAARVFFEDGRVQNLEHWLTLKAASQPSPEIAKSPSPPHTHGAVSAGNMSHSAGDDRWDWTVFLIADDKTFWTTSTTWTTRCTPRFPILCEELAREERLRERAFS